jgi:hypothetical protein
MAKDEQQKAPAQSTPQTHPVVNVPRDKDGNPINTPQTAAFSGTANASLALGGPNAEQARTAHEVPIPRPELRQGADPRSEAQRLIEDEVAKQVKEATDKLRKEFADKARKGESLGEMNFDAPEGIAGQPGAELLLRACNRYGINPDPAAGELANWHYYPAFGGVPEHVKFVTFGGLKLSEPIEADRGDSEARLRQWLGAYRRDASGALIPTTLPVNQFLPSEAVTGYPRNAARARGRVEDTAGKVEVTRAVIQSHGRVA